MANEQDHAEKDPDFCKSVLAENIGNTVDGQSQQQGPLGEDKPSSNRDRNSLKIKFRKVLNRSSEFMGIN